MKCTLVPLRLWAFHGIQNWLELVVFGFRFKGRFCHHDGQGLNATGKSQHNQKENKTENAHFLFD